MDNMIKKPRNWLVLPLLPGDGPSRFSKRIQKIWKTLNSDPDITEEITIDQIAEQEGEEPSTKCVKAGLHREVLKELSYFEESADFPNCVELDFGEYSMLVKMSIDKFSKLLMEFEAEALPTPPMPNMVYIRRINSKGFPMDEDED